MEVHQPTENRQGNTGEDNKTGRIDVPATALTDGTRKSAKGKLAEVGYGGLPLHKGKKGEKNGT